MLTIARGISFTSAKQVFIVAGSNELGERTDVTGGVFDSMTFVEEVSQDVMKGTLDKRIRFEDSRRPLDSTFDREAVDATYAHLSGISKDGLRLAANALTEAAIENEVSVKQGQVRKAQSRSIARLSEALELRAFEALGEVGELSLFRGPSESLEPVTAAGRQDSEGFVQAAQDSKTQRRQALQVLGV